MSVIIEQDVNLKVNDGLSATISLVSDGLVAKASLVSDAIIGHGDKLPDYKGSYSVTPKVTEQKLETKNKSMTDDVTIFQIPYSEVSNPSGGTTITIGLE